MPRTKPKPATLTVESLLQGFPTEALTAQLGATFKPLPASPVAPRADSTDWEHSRTKALLDVPRLPANKPRRNGNRNYIPGPKDFTGHRWGTWTHYMGLLILTHRSIRGARGAHILTESPAWRDKALDFKWMADKGYITFI